MNSSIILPLVITILAIAFCIFVLLVKAKSTKLGKPIEETGRDKGKLALGSKDYKM